MRRRTALTPGRRLLAAAVLLTGCAGPDPSAVPGTHDTSASPEASYRLALEYLNGNGLAQDEGRALTLLGRAADAGHVEAQFVLAETYSGGIDGVREPAWATMWYGRAAALGHAESQYRLALAHAEGVGTSVDFIEAYKWATIAAEAGHPAASRLRERLAGRMIREEIAPATEAAARFRPAVAQSEPDEPLVRFVQFALWQMGYDPGPIDGIYGPRTRSAIEAVAQRERIRADGITRELAETLRLRLRTMQSAERRG